VARRRDDADPTVAEEVVIAVQDLRGGGAQPVVEFAVESGRGRTVRERRVVLGALDEQRAAAELVAMPT